MSKLSDKVKEAVGTALLGKPTQAELPVPPQPVEPKDGKS